MTWNFIKAWPVAWSVASLESMNNEILIESISMSYNYFTTKIIT
ncbi:phage tail protein [Candidatus Marifrigoribacter sp. Uisw_064]